MDHLDDDTMNYGDISSVISTDDDEEDPSLQLGIAKSSTLTNRKTVWVIINQLESRIQ